MSCFKKMGSMQALFSHTYQGEDNDAGGELHWAIRDIPSTRSLFQGEFREFMKRFESIPHRGCLMPGR